MSDVDVLEMEIQNMKNDISEIKEDLKEIKNMFNKLDDRYPTRREFKTVVSVI
jgi:preprotein translocase subunit Sss1